MIPKKRKQWYREQLGINKNYCNSYFLAYVYHGEDEFERSFLSC